MGKALILLLAALPALAQSTCDQQLIALYRQKAAQLSAALTVVAAREAEVARLNASVANLNAQLAPFAWAVGVIRLDPVTVVAMCQPGQAVDARGGCS